MRNIKVVDFTYGRRSSDDVNTSLPFTDNYKETKTIQQANGVIAAYINENIKDIAEVNSNLDDLVVEVESKQDELVSGENIKTINGETILGSGDISVVSDVSWGNITGDIYDQTDLQNALADKQDELVSGTNFKTINSNSLLGSGDVTVQATLVSGTNIKTINGETILGSGDIPVVSDVSWGNITGDIDDQTDLQNALDGKQDELISGENIKTVNSNSLLGSGNININTMVGNALSIQTENIDCGIFSGNVEKYNQTYSVNIPTGYKCVGIAGWYLTGGSFTNLYINEIYYDSNKIHWSLKNGVNSPTDIIIMTVKLLLVKTQ